MKYNLLLYFFNIFAIEINLKQREAKEQQKKNSRDFYFKYVIWFFVKKNDAYGIVLNSLHTEVHCF